MYCFLPILKYPLALWLTCSMPLPKTPLCRAKPVLQGSTQMSPSPRGVYLKATHLTHLLALPNTYSIWCYSWVLNSKSSRVAALMQDVLSLTDDIYGQAPCLIHLCALHTVLHMAESW